ncbi:MAG: potassium transporter KefB [Chitinophagaceae bacterium]|nr:potassium transporter KefB [Chitinophagaceae bacterium]
MVQTDNSTSQPHQISLVTRVLVGAGIGLLLISLFLLSAGDPNPEWGKLWMIRPLIIVPLAGAMGGLCNYFIVHFHNYVGVNKAIAMIVSVIVFIIGLWLGIVLGLDGTMWN